MSTRVQSSVYCEPQSLPAIMDAVYFDLAGQGIDAPYAVGDTSGIFPHSIDAHWNVSGTDSPVDAVKAAVKRHSGIFQAWGDFSEDFNSQVVIPTVMQAADDTKKAVPKVLNLTEIVSVAAGLLAVAYLAFKFA